MLFLLYTHGKRIDVSDLKLAYGEGLSLALHVASNHEALTSVDQTASVPRRGERSTNKVTTWTQEVGMRTTSNVELQQGSANCAT